MPTDLVVDGANWLAPEVVVKFEGSKLSLEEQKLRYEEKDDFWILVLKTSRFVQAGTYEVTVCSGDSAG